MRGKLLAAADRIDESDAAFDEALALSEGKGDVASARRLVEERSPTTPLGPHVPTSSDARTRDARLLLPGRD